MNRFLICLFCLLCCYSAVAQKTDWKKDVRYLRKELPERHVQLFAKLPESSFHQRLNWLEEHCDTMSDLDVQFYLLRLFAEIGDAHTSIEIGKDVINAGILPMHLLKFADGYYVIYTLPEYKRILGSRLKAMNEFPLRQLEDSLRLLLPDDGSGYATSKLRNLLISQSALRIFGFSSNDQQTTKITVEDSSGEEMVFNMKTDQLNRQNRVGKLPDSLNFILKSERELFDVFWQSNDSILYIMYNKCWSRELEQMNGVQTQNSGVLPSFEEFSNRILRMADQYPVRKLVMDFRFNKGGSSAQGDQLIEEMAKHRTLKSIPVFAVISQLTFSSAVLNVMKLKEDMHAILVGEIAGGTPSHFGEVKYFYLPSSGVKVSYSTKFFKRIDGGTNLLYPDIKVNESYADFMKGEDAFYNAIRNYKP